MSAWQLASLAMPECNERQDRRDRRQNCSDQGGKARLTGGMSGLAAKVRAAHRPGQSQRNVEADQPGLLDMAPQMKIHALGLKVHRAAAGRDHRTGVENNGLSGHDPARHCDPAPDFWRSSRTDFGGANLQGPEPAMEPFHLLPV